MFLNFEFIETKFNNNNLESIAGGNIKVWKLTQYTEIETLSDFTDFSENISDND